MDYRDDYQPGARRFDVGQRTKFELVPMAIAALEQLAAWASHASPSGSPRSPRRSPSARAAARAHPDPAAQRGPHLLGLAVPDDLRDAVLPALAAADCYAALRGRSLRISPHLHVTDADVDRLVRALQDATAAPR